MLGAAYEWHNYAHTPIGARSDIENVNIERLQASIGSTTNPTTRC
jgi:zinc protease